MTLKRWLATATGLLQKADIPSARLDCLILLEDVLHKDRAYLLAHPEIELTREQKNKLDRQIQKRIDHEPLAYIRGFTEFYGRRFKVSKYVLEPRPESETMIEFLRRMVDGEWQAGAALSIADVGTGSGALGITAALEIPGALVDLYDIDSNCLAVAKHNAIMHELHLHAYKRDLLNRPARHYDVVLANLPYVPTHWTIDQSVKMEPRIAIDGGKDGLELYRRLFSQLSRQHTPPRFAFTESMPPQHEELAKIAGNNGYKQEDSQDFIQVFSRNT